MRGADMLQSRLIQLEAGYLYYSNIKLECSLEIIIAIGGFVRLRTFYKDKM